MGRREKFFSSLFSIYYTERKERSDIRLKILFVSLGCDKNLVDTEMMLGMLSEHGYEFTNDETEADVIVVNTCCFIGDAKEESINTLIEMGQWKENGKCKALIAAGCLAQRYKEDIEREIPEVDAMVGTTAIDKVVETIDSVLAGKGISHVEDINLPPVYDQKRIVTTGGHFAYLKIAEGCDKRCTYCIIPKVRGNYRSIPMESLVSEAEKLVKNGAKELILVAQETTLYGKDLYGEKKLPELLRRLCKINGLVWIRILYCYPEEITDELIQVMKEEKKVCHYLDMPIQHASDAILKKMARRTTRAEITEKIAKLREEIPDICLRTTLITGFPGETEEDHEIMMEFVDEIEFDRLGVFTYSQEEDTVAAEMPDQIDEEVKKDRQADVLELQQEIAYDRAADCAGQVVMAMIEGKVADENAYIARTYKDAPNVDGYLFINTSRELMSGDIVMAHITGSYEYDLIGVLEDEFTE